MSYKLGDKILINLIDGSEVEGVFVPSKDDDFLLIKLDSGYNRSINKKKIKNIKLVLEHKEKMKTQDKISQDENLPLIYVLHVGGTIASKVDYTTGGVSAQIDSSELIESIPGIKNLARIKTKVLMNMMSENVRFEHFNIFAKDIISLLEDEKIDGIILSHGTDTLHYTSAALSFILQNIKIPVVLVGSQRSSDRPSSDSTLNLLCAIKFIIDQKTNDKNLTGFFACMHANSGDDYCNIFRPTNLRKMHTSRRDAFKQINSMPIAEVHNDKIKYFELGNTDNISPLFEPAYFRNDIKVGILKSHPNMFAEEIAAYKNYNGLILESTGLGHVPIIYDDKITKENKNIEMELKKLCEEMPVIITAQCINGSTNLNVYGPGRKLIKLGVLGAGPIITETAFIKLAWLLSNFSKKEIKQLWKRNFVGEILSRDLYEKISDE